MNSRTTLQTLLTVVVLAAMSAIPTRALAADSGQAQYYELRVYAIKSERQRDLVNNYWQTAAVPAYNRAGIQPIGVFTEL
jgi:hypothetical protein